MAANSLKSLWRTTGSMSPLSVRHKLPSSPCTIAQHDEKVKLCVHGVGGREEDASGYTQSTPNKDNSLSLSQKEATTGWHKKKTGVEIEQIEMLTAFSPWW